MIQMIKFEIIMRKILALRVSQGSLDVFFICISCVSHIVASMSFNSSLKYEVFEVIEALELAKRSFTLDHIKGSETI